MTGHDYRLLTEAEWEYAARGVTSADDPRNGEIWSFGDDFSHAEDFAWFAGNQTHPVGTLRANPFGLYDMHGNVWEWVQDCYAAYDPSKLDGSAVESDRGMSGSSDEDTSCSNADGWASTRVVRGGDYNDLPGDLRSAYRFSQGPEARSGDLGFRVARTL